MPQELFTSSYLGKNYSLLGVKQEVVCVADACLFGFHVSMATGTYLPCAVGAVVPMVLTMCHYCILYTFFTVKRAERVVSDVNLCRDNS